MDKIVIIISRIYIAVMTVLGFAGLLHNLPLFVKIIATIGLLISVTIILKD